MSPSSGGLENADITIRWTNALDHPIGVLEPGIGGMCIIILIIMFTITMIIIVHDCKIMYVYIPESFVRIKVLLVLRVHYGSQN